LIAILKAAMLKKPPCVLYINRQNRSPNSDKRITNVQIITTESFIQNLSYSEEIKTRVDENKK
jgi:hypothetical protein